MMRSLILITSILFAQCTREQYAREPKLLNIEMKEFIMQSIYKNNDRKIRHLGSKRFGIQFVFKGIYTCNGILYVHTQTKNNSNVPFDRDFIKFKIIDNKVPKRTAIQETVLDAVRSYNEVMEIGGKTTVRTVYASPKFTIPDEKILLVEL